MSNELNRYLELAAKVSRIKEDGRTYFHGAVGIRKDGVLVCASNGNPKEPEPKHHCEYRICNKLGKGGRIYLVRTLADGSFGDSTPCSTCSKIMKSYRVKSCVFTLSSNTVVVYSPMNDWEYRMVIG